MRNTRLDEAQARIKLGEISTTSYNTTLMAESKEELKSVLIKVKEREKVGSKLNIQKTEDHWPLVPFMANRRGKNGYSDRLDFLGFQNQFKW